MIQTCLKYSGLSQNFLYSNVKYDELLGGLFGVGFTLWFAMSCSSILAALTVFCQDGTRLQSAFESRAFIASFELSSKRDKECGVVYPRNCGELDVELGLKRGNLYLVGSGRGEN